MPPHPPSVDALAASLDDGTLPRAVLVDIARTAIAGWRADGEGDPADRAATAARVLARRRSRRVVNATGVLLHTNLGRAPIHPAAAQAEAAAAAGYTPLEMDLVTGTRGGRGAHAAALVRAVTGAEAALVVNNNAGALLLTVAALAGGREAVMSRGEQIEIGGSFRLPEIVAAAGARGIEVGTTNRTRIKDFASAIGPATGVLLKVHPSNYRVEGFTAEVSYRDLAALGRERGVPMVADIGSGLLDERVPWITGDPPAWLEGEPGARQTLDAGADLVLFSGDKLLGGPQAGIVAGRRDLVTRLAEHPLARAVRIGGAPLDALAATLDLYAAGRGAEIPFWAMATIPAEVLRTRAEALVAAAGVGRVVEDRSLPGAGSVPGRGIPGPIVAIDGAGETHRRLLLDAEPPIVTRLDRDHLVVDLRAVDPEDDRLVADALTAACR